MIHEVLDLDRKLIIRRVEKQEGCIVLQAEWRKKTGKCPGCGRVSRKVHQKCGRRRVLHEVRAGGERVYVEFPRVRLWCSQCGKAFVLRPRGVFPWVRVTKYMLMSIFERLRTSSFREVSRWSGMNPGTLRSYVKKLLDWKVDWELFRGQEVIRLGVDEHRMGKGRMALLVVELVSSTPLAILRDDRKATLREFLSTIPTWVKERVDEMAIDLRSGYKYALKETFRGARVVADEFHVIRLANQALDEQRQLEQEIRRGTGEEVRIPRLLLMKGYERLGVRGREKVRALLERYPTLGPYYDLKEELRALYRCSSIEEAREHLRMIVEGLQRQRDRTLQRIARTLRRWWNEILAHFRSRTTTAKVEGYNNKLEMLKRISYGFRDIEIYGKKMMLGLVPINLLPQLLT